ncbi:hypothetical protein CHS0354_007963 [Potamilus streckersoni]|uniref:Uncharacterized protein n=1 Tax=Potamilus streckersoni TaxID=2493646 RepID=A0AAE0SBY0_9BIVA|nr:hypothetical protein CHS0354_007963 [Potamilus streckersoni]
MAADTLCTYRDTGNGRVDETSQLDMYRSSPSRTQSASSLGIVPFGFHSRTNYDANETLIQFRSDNFTKKEMVVFENIWKRPPPDFRPQKFAPNPPKRNSIEANQPWRYGTILGKRESIKRPRTKVIPRVLQPPKEEEKTMTTRFRIMRPFTAKKKFVTEGMYAAGEYHMPKPHDFRGYPPLKSLGLDEFDIFYEKDPYNIKFTTERLNIVHGTKIDKATDREIKGRQMAPPKTPEPKFDSQLTLQKEPWPIKNGAFTRHRIRHRPAHSAFMERATAVILSKWEKEQSQE